MVIAFLLGKLRVWPGPAAPSCFPAPPPKGSRATSRLGRSSQDCRPHQGGGGPRPLNPQTLLHLDVESVAVQTVRQHLCVSFELTRLHFLKRGGGCHFSPLREKLWLYFLRKAVSFSQEQAVTSCLPAVGGCARSA